MSKLSLGIEFGSTRIKAVLINDELEVLSIGTYDWENQLVNNLWTYSKEEILKGLKGCYSSLKKEYESKFNTKLTKIDSLGFSAMMHGYIALDKNDNLLTNFRTWRNTNTGKSAAKLSKLFNFNIPMRWSIAHLYQVILDDEPHVKDIAYVTTLAGYVHYLLTGKKVLGVGDASGMFPIDTATKNYNEAMLNKFDDLIANKNYRWKIRDVLPEVLNAGQQAGVLTEDGVKLLDESGDLLPGVPLCPGEGDAGTGMMATNAIKPGTGNVSAGTSVFAMIVMKKNLSKAYPEIDVVTTPHGENVAMVHCNTCTSDINAWAGMFAQLFNEFGYKVETKDLYSKLFALALEDNKDFKDIINFNYFSGEPITKCEFGRPLLVRSSDAKLSIQGFMKSQIFSSLATLALGMNILTKEGITIDKMCGHGGFFKSKETAGRYMSCAVNAPISIQENAGEGGAWGMAILANYLLHNEVKLESYIENVFKNSKDVTINSTEQDRKDFATYLKKYKSFIKVEKQASEVK